jgi:hypothetical protein
VIYSLIVDDAGPFANRHEVRDKLNEILLEPFGDEAEPETEEDLAAQWDAEVAAGHHEWSEAEAKPVARRADAWR